MPAAREVTALLRERLKPPSTKHLLGTDNLGRDLFSRIVYGAHISVIIGLVASAINVALATMIGSISGTGPTYWP